MAEKGLARQPQQHRGILADAPEHREVLKLIERLAHDVDRLIFEFGKVVHLILMPSSPKMCESRIQLC